MLHPPTNRGDKLGRCAHGIAAVLTQAMPTSLIISGCHVNLWKHYASIHGPARALAPPGDHSPGPRHSGLSRCLCLYFRTSRPLQPPSTQRYKNLLPQSTVQPDREFESTQQ